MKISLNIKFIDGPYGGGMQFANSIKNALEYNNHIVVNHLNDNDIDIIFHIVPFPFIMSISSYSYIEAYLYKLNHPNTVIIHRINECDERKGTNYLNKLLVEASKFSDYTIYIASWLVPIFVNLGLNKGVNSCVILNGADSNIFNRIGKLPWNQKDKLKIVTHHWGGNYNKGHDIYKQLDELLSNSEFSQNYEFTFIGNLPANIIYKNTTVIKPLSGHKLAEELKKHHIYLTASRNEPAGMHHIEGALCGLPLLYINSGSLPEYCNGYGIEYNPQNFADKLNQLRNEYSKWYFQIENYNNTAERMVQQYYNIIESIYNNRNHYSPELTYSKLYLYLRNYYLNVYWKVKNLL